MKCLFLFLGLCTFQFRIYGQSTILKTIDSAELHKLEINLDNTFQINMVNNANDQIIFSAVSEGEYKDRLLIKAERKATTLLISEADQPFVQDYDDKLSAHKVQAIKVIIEVPDYLDVSIYSRNASVGVDGNYRSLIVELLSGDCILTNFLGSATINTVNGDIKVKTSDAVVSALSKLGSVKKELLTGSNIIKLSSVRGDIKVCRIR